MKIDRKLLYAIEGMVVLFVIWAIAGVFIHATRISSVYVSLNEDGIEHKDKSIGELGKMDEPPDYRLRCRTNDGWVELGTFVNTWIGEGLVFVVNPNLPSKEVIEIQLLDDDKFEDDVLEQFPYDGGRYTGGDYTIEVTETMSLESGFSWFFKTPVGIAILAGITLGVLIVILVHLPF